MYTVDNNVEHNDVCNIDTDPHDKNPRRAPLFPIGPVKPPSERRNFTAGPLHPQPAPPGQWRMTVTHTGSPRHASWAKADHSPASSSMVKFSRRDQHQRGTWQLRQRRGGVTVKRGLCNGGRRPGHRVVSQRQNPRSGTRIVNAQPRRPLHRGPGSTSTAPWRGRCAPEGRFATTKVPLHNPLPKSRVAAARGGFPRDLGHFRPSKSRPGGAARATMRRGLSRGRARHGRPIPNPVRIAYGARTARSYDGEMSPEVGVPLLIPVVTDFVTGLGPDGHRQG